MVMNLFGKQPPRIAKPCLLSMVAVLSLCTSCTLIADTGREQCSQDTDCASHGAEYAGYVCIQSVCTEPAVTTPWSCLGKVVWPSATDGNVVATLNLKDIVTYQPITGVTGRLCRKLDVQCAQPLAAGLTSDENGRLSVEAPSGFDGYVELTSAEALPGIYFFYPPLTAAREIPFVPLLPLAQLSGFMGLVGSSFVQGRGQIVTAAYDCDRKPAEGVTFTSPNTDSLSAVFYMIKGMPSTRVTATDSSGYGGIINLPPGSVNLSGQLATGDVIGTQSLLIRPDQVTYSTVLPMPQ